MDPSIPLTWLTLFSACLGTLTLKYLKNNAWLYKCLSKHLSEGKSPIVLGDSHDH